MAEHRLHPVPESSILNPIQRKADLEALRTETFDIVIVGGGVTGAGAALDAATRGLKVALIEAGDLASGTSSKSSKLIHGGLRYLEMLDFGLVREALRERRRLLTTLAPHLVKPVNFIWPLTHPVWERAYVGAGLVLYDTMGGTGGVPRHRHLSKTGMKRMSPGLDPAAYTGGLHFYDAIEDDARMVMTIARTAKAHGARIITRATAGAVEQRSDGLTVTVRDGEGGETIAVRSRHLSYAVGVWSDQLEPGTLTVRPSKGVHILVDRQLIDSAAGVLMRTEKSVLFLIPWGEYWLIGDTDTDWPLDRGRPVASGADLDYLLEKVNSILTRKLTRGDIVGSFAGLRPLVQTDPNADTTRLSREHSVVSPGQNMTMIAGGKYTTYRVMAEDLIDAAVAESGLRGGPSRTVDAPLLGAEGYERIHHSEALLLANGLTEATAKHLIGRYGDRVADILALIASEKSLGETIQGYAPYVWAEIAYACSHEGARSVADILERRTRIRIQFRDSGRSILPQVAALAAQTLDWDPARVADEIADFERDLDAEAAAHETSDDVGALEAYDTVV